MGYRITTEEVTSVGTELAEKLNHLLGVCTKRKGKMSNTLADGRYHYRPQYGVYFQRKGSSTVWFQISGTCGANRDAYDRMRYMLRAIDFTEACCGVQNTIVTPI